MFLKPLLNDGISVTMDKVKFILLRKKYLYSNTELRTIVEESGLNWEWDIEYKSFIISC